MCDEFDEYHKENYTFMLKKGSVLYSGNTMDKEIVSLKDIFNYVGQRGIKVVNNRKNYVLYASSDFNVAWGYAASCQRHGYIHKFKVTKDVLLLRGDIFEDAELVDKCICSPYDYKGFAVIYSPGKDEYALCNSEEFLEYVSSIRCKFDAEKWVDITLEEYADDVGIAASDLTEIEIEN